MSYTYSAFISYRHLPTDIAAAKAVQQALETYVLPRDIQKKKNMKKLNRCFRDQDELPLADDLGSSIKKALRESEWLIVICTPDLPGSNWCRKEIEYFIALERLDKIIPVLVSGEPKDSYPPQITHVVTKQGKEEKEPLAADLRGKMEKQLKTEKLRIIACMLGLNFFDLKNREQERTFRRRLILFSVVFGVVSVFTGLAVYQNGLLTKERNLTARNATELLIEKSVRSTAEGDLGSGLTYALQAFAGSRIFEQEYDAAVSAALEAAMYPELFSQIGSLKDNGILHRWASLSSDGRFIACCQSDDSVQIYSSVNGERLYTIRNFGWIGKAARYFSPDSRYVCRFSDDTAALYGVKEGTETLRETLPEGWSVSYRGLTAKNEVPVVLNESGTAALYDLFEKKLTVLDGVSLSGDRNDKVFLHHSGHRGFWSDGTKIWLVDTETAEVLLTLETAQGSYTNDEWYFQYRDGNEYVYLRWDTLEEVCRTEHRGSYYPGVLSPDGTLLATDNSSDGFCLWDARTGEALWTEGHNSGNTIYDLAFADNDTLIASHEELQIYRISDRSVVYDSGEDRTTYGFGFSAGRLVMPLRSGGCLVNLLPEENDLLPHATVETREDFRKEELAAATVQTGLAGFWNGITYYMYYNGQYGTVETDEPGVVYFLQDQAYTLHPTNGVAVPSVYVSPDGKWQALIRSEEVDIFRAEEGPEPVLTIPGNGYDRLCAAIWGDTLALGAYVENAALFDLNTGDCLGTVKTGAMCMKLQFSPDGKHLIAYSGMAAQAVVASTENFAVIMRIPATDIYANLTVGFNQEGTEAVVLYPDGHADVGLLYQDLDTLVEKAKKYTE